MLRFKLTVLVKEAPGGQICHYYAVFINSLFRLTSKKTANLRITGAYSEGNRSALDTPHKEPVMQKTFPCHVTSRRYRFNVPLQWRHNGYDSVSNHQPHDCLLNRLFKRRSKKTSRLRVDGLCAHKWPVTRKMFSFDDVIMHMNSVRYHHKNGPSWRFIHMCMHSYSTLAWSLLTLVYLIRLGPNLSPLLLTYTRNLGWYVHNAPNSISPGQNCEGTDRRIECEPKSHDLVLRRIYMRTCLLEAGMKGRDK